MKKIIILGAALLFGGLAQAQSPTFGIKAGVNIAKFANRPGCSATTAATWHLLEL